MNKKVVDMSVVFSNRIEDALKSLLGVLSCFSLPFGIKLFTLG